VTQPRTSRIGGHRRRRSSSESLRGGNGEEDRTCAGHGGLALRYGGGTVDEEFFQDLLDQMSDGIYFITLDRRITYWNGGAERMTGYSADEVVDTVARKGSCATSTALVGVVSAGMPAAGGDGRRQAPRGHVYLHHKDGQRVPVTVRGQALRDADGKIVGSVEVFSTREVIRTRATARPLRTTHWIP